MPVAEEVPVIADVPVAEDIPVTEDVPVVVHGKLNALGVNVVGGMVNGRLRPPAPSSVEPIGIPTRPTDDTEPIPVGEEAEAAGPAKELPAVVGQVPDAFPTMPPPSNTVGDIEVPTVEVLVPVDVPAIELPMLDDEVPVPEAVTEIPRPKDDSGIEPPKPLHPVVVVEPDTVGVIGLTPGDCISVAPRGMRVGGTGTAGPMPSGDVMPSGEGPGEICAKAEPHPKRTAAVVKAAALVAIAKRVIVLDPI